MSKQKNNFCTQHVVNLYFSGNSMNVLVSYHGLIDARIKASEKGLPGFIIKIQLEWLKNEDFVKVFRRFLVTEFVKTCDEHVLNCKWFGHHDHENLAFV